ncbi:MAG: PD-(D/E)XK nuclease family protein [Clostridia bacterium]|nr:PD-(D/E)XK nuclease family protein [Clostridia bacterium]
MNEICVVLGNNFNDVNKTAIKLIDYKNLGCQNVIIIPDRFSLLMEKQIFNVLNISSTINISVMGISRFANSVFNKLNFEYEYVSKQESLLLIRKAIMNKQGKLTSFKNKISAGLCEEIFNTITQLKANEVKFGDIEKIKDFLNPSELNKLSDIALIFEEYERLLGEKLDSTKILTYLENAISKMDYADHNFFFLNFEALTKQGYSVLKALAKAGKSLIVGALQPDFQNNAFIFENDIYEKIKQLSVGENIALKIIQASCTLQKPNMLIHKNLYSLKVDKKNFSDDLAKDFIRIFEANDINEEVLELTRRINFLVKNEKVEYKNIAVACGNLEVYADYIENEFEKLGFSFYIDTGKKIAETQTVRYLILILNLINKNFPLNLIENFINSEFTEISPEQKNLLIDYILKFDIHSDNLFQKFSDISIEKLKNEIFNNFIMLNSQKNNCKTGQDFVELINLIIKTFSIFEKNNKLFEKFKQNNLIKEEKLYIQLPEKSTQILESLEKIMGFEKLNFDEFLELFESGLKEIELSTVPVSVNSIFVGDATTSFFEETLYLFVLGANEGVLPRNLNDTGILSDEIISDISQVADISPTVKMINRRNRFKVFNLLLQPVKKIFISYCLTAKSREKLLPSGFVLSLQKIFSENNEPLPVIRNSDYLKFFETTSENEKDLCEHFAYYCVNEQNAMHEILKLNSDLNKFNKNVLSSMYECLKNNIKNYDDLTCFKIEQEEALKLNFKNRTTSVSKIEKYYSCPFKYFSADALKLRERDKPEIMPADSGKFLHKVAEEFLKPENDFVNLIKNFNEKEIQKESEASLKQNIEIDSNNQSELKQGNKLNYIKENCRVILLEIVKKIIRNIKKDEKFYKFNLKLNKNATLILGNESLRLCEFLYYSQTVSKFRPAFSEIYFGGKRFPAYELKAGEETFYLTGIVDRVDVYDDMFIIIDYKSGSDSAGGYPEVFYGDKIQIFAYLEILEKLLNKKACGAFYFPIKNEYKEEKDKNKEYILKGKAVHNTKFLSAMDTSVNSENPLSKIFSCKLNVSKKILETGEKEYSKAYTVPENVLDNMKEYTICMIEKALTEILSGDISPSPKQGACQFCKFASLCHYDKKQGFRSNIYEINKQFFENLKNDNIN